MQKVLKFDCIREHEVFGKNLVLMTCEKEKSRYLKENIGENMDNTTIIIILVALVVVCVGIFYFLKNSGDDVKKIDPESIEKTKKTVQPLRSNTAKTAQLENLRTKVAQTKQPSPQGAQNTVSVRKNLEGVDKAPSAPFSTPSEEESQEFGTKDYSDGGSKSTQGVAKEAVMPAPMGKTEDTSVGFINIVSKTSDIAKDASGRLDAQFPGTESQPVVSDRPTQAIIPSVPTRSVGDKQKPSILLVDDSKVIRVKTEKLLTSAGYQVTLAIDGIDALAKLETLHPDVIITDIEMPNLDGFGLVRSVKNNLQTSEIPVIVMTSHVNLHLDIAATEGINGFLPKPFTDKELFEQVSYLVGS